VTRTLVLGGTRSGKSEVAEALAAAAPRLASGGVLVLERATRRPIEAPAPLTRVRDVTSGDSTLTFITVQR
jgi:hypothetical protein